MGNGHSSSAELPPSLFELGSKRFPYDGAASDDKAGADPQADCCSSEDEDEEPREEDGKGHDEEGHSAHHRGEPRLLADVIEKGDDAPAVDFSAQPWTGKALLVVNVASQCGYTEDNYKQLVRLANDYADRDVAILLFPCNQFLWQEPGTCQRILDFAQKKQATADNMVFFERTNVKGKHASPVYKFLNVRFPPPLLACIGGSFVRSFMFC
jgi:glutathione peroxidase